MGRGGYRIGAGRKKKDRTPEGIFEDAEHYLTAVVCGLTRAEPARITAAKTLIAYQKARQRAPVKSPAPRDLYRKAISGIEKAKRADFEEKASEIRAKLRGRK